MWKNKEAVTLLLDTTEVLMVVIINTLFHILKYSILFLIQGPHREKGEGLRNIKIQVYKIILP